MFVTQRTINPTYLGADTTQPHIRAAGYTSTANETAKDIMTWSSERPSTPDHIKKYRQTTVLAPGARAKHWGTAEDPVPEGPYGAKTRSQPGQSVAEAIKQGPQTEMSLWHEAQAEGIYHSTKREPLGKGYTRGLNIPDELGTTKAFGKACNARDLDRAGQALHVIFPSDQPGDDDENPATHDQYVRTHGAFLPGEQRRRNYDWQRTGVDPDSHRFGAVDKAGVVEGVRKALQPELDETLPHAPRVVARALDEHKAVATDELGRTKQLGGGDRPHLPPDHAYGLPLRRGPNEPTVDDLLRGGYPADEQQPDADLGKSIRPGFRNIAPEGRTFGVPSVRTDLPLPQGARSVANATNYGNEPDVMQLICPPKSAQRGIGNDMYVVPRAKGELKALVAAAGISVSDSEFETLFDASAAADGRTAEHASLGTFMKLRHQALAASMGL